MTYKFPEVRPTYTLEDLASLLPDNVEESDKLQPYGREPVFQTMSRLPSPAYLSNDESSMSKAMNVPSSIPRRPMRPHDEKLLAL
jgi:hypothetical protein